MKNEFNQSLNGALALLKELRDTTPIVMQRKRIDAFLAINHDSQREISVVDEELLYALADLVRIEAIEGASTRKIMAALRSYVSKPKPVSISLEDAKRAYNNGRARSGAENMNLLNSTQREDVRHEGGIVAVLDAAGVKYAD